MKNNKEIYFLGIILYFVCAYALIQCDSKKPIQTPKVQKPDFFASDKLFSLSLSFDRAYFDTLNEGTRLYHHALCTVTEPNGKTIKIPAQIKLRGQFRSDTSNCDTPQLKVKLDKKWMGIKNFDLVLPCKQTLEYKQYLLQEYWVYQFYQQFCTYSYQTKIIRLQIPHQEQKTQDDSFYAILLESDKDLEKRLNVKEVETVPLDTLRINPLVYHKILQFQYVIGNDDWLIHEMHNIKIFEKNKGELFPIPYDFDFAGIISPPYAMFDTSAFYTAESAYPQSTLGDFVVGKLKSTDSKWKRMIAGDSLLKPSTKAHMIRFIQNSLKKLSAKNTP